MDQDVSGINGNATLRAMAGDRVDGGAAGDTLVLASVQDIAFDPVDRTSGTVTFVDDSMLFFRQLTDFLFDAGKDGVVDGVVDGMGPIDAMDATVPDGGACDRVDGGEDRVDHDRLVPPLGAAVLRHDDNPENGVATFANDGALTFCNVENAVIPCFTTGTLLQTDKGQVRVEDIRPGHRVLTRDRGFRPVVWAGQRELTLAEVTAQPDLAPVRIEKGALGPNMPAQAMTLSPQHRLLVEGPRTRLLFGTREVLVPALHLEGYPGITRAACAPVRYTYIMCAAHEVIWSDGIWTESFQPSEQSMQGLNAAQRHELKQIFPKLGAGAQLFPAARRTLRRDEADLLLA